MNILALDTSTSILSLALDQDGNPVREFSCEPGRRLSDELPGLLENFLRQSGMDFRGLDVICVGLGPGAFTSLRVGLAAVKGLSLALEVPVIGVSSHDAIAREAAETGTNCSISVVTDAKRRMVYAGDYMFREGELQRKGELRLAKTGEVLASLRPPAILTGDGCGLYADEIRASDKEIQVSAPELWPPRAARLIELSRSRRERREYDNAASLIPLYLYPDTCQINPSK